MNKAKPKFTLSIFMEGLSCKMHNESLVFSRLGSLLNSIIPLLSSSMFMEIFMLRHFERPPPKSES